MVTVSLHTFALKSHSLLKEFQHELTWPLSKCSVLRTELLRQSFRLFFPLWAPLLWAAFPPYSRAGSIIKGEDIFNEERSQRFDFVRHFHLLILRQKSLSGLPGGWIGSSVSPHTLPSCEFIQEQGRVSFDCTDMWRRRDNELCFYLQQHPFVASSDGDKPTNLFLGRIFCTFTS